MKLRRVRGSGPVGARMFALLVLSVAAWAPFALAAVLSLPAAIAYLGAAVAVSLAYGGALPPPAATSCTRSPGRGPPPSAGSGTRSPSKGGAAAGGAAFP